MCWSSWSKHKDELATNLRRMLEHTFWNGTSLLSLRLFDASTREVRAFWPGPLDENPPTRFQVIDASTGEQIDEQIRERFFTPR